MPETEGERKNLRIKVISMGAAGQCRVEKNTWQQENVGRLRPKELAIYSWHPMSGIQILLCQSHACFLRELSP